MAKWQAATICATIINAAGGINGKAVQPQDYLLDFEVDVKSPEEVAEEKRAEIMKTLERFAGLHNATHAGTTSRGRPQTMKL